MSVLFRDTTKEDKSKDSLTEKLNVLLASYSVSTQNVRGFHWNVESPLFYSLHKVLDTMYNAGSDAADLIAERIRQFDKFPIHSLSDFVSKSIIKETKNVTDCMEISDHIISDSDKLLELIKEIEKMAIDKGDIVTSDIMIELARKLEKDLWMIKSFKKHLK